MDERITDLYHIPNIERYEDIHILELKEHCDHLEEQVHQLLLHLNEHDRQIITAYMDVRNDLELETLKAAMRWARKNFI